MEQTVKKVAFYTLGCKLNFSESAAVSRKFEEKGYQKVRFEETPDIFIINTCSVTDHADKKCRKIVNEARKISPDAYVAIIGCYAQLKPKEISEIPGVDAVLGAAEKFRLVELLDGFVRRPEAQIFASPIEAADTFHSAGSGTEDRSRSFLKVQDGCDYSCSFCTIPLARGKSRSNPMEKVLEEARAIGQSGIREIVLTGVNTGDYGLINGERKYRFIDLIRKLDQIESIDRFRISSIEPNLLTDEIISFVAGSQRFVPHFHIPLQSGSDEILSGMRRRYRSDLYADRVRSIKEKMPHCCIGVDVITGFPGETEAHFLQTYQFLNEVDISYLHVFPYSERDHTLAKDMGDSVPVKVRKERSKMLQILSEKKRRHFYEQHLGENASVLFENEIREGGTAEGFTENYIRVAVKYDPLIINEIREVRLLKINENGRVEVEEVVPDFVKQTY